MPCPRLLFRTGLACAVLLVVPAPALAVEGFVGVLESGSLVRFAATGTTGLTTPIPPRGLAPRERFVALGSRPGGRVVGVGSSARLYSLDPRSGRATPIGQPFAEGLRGVRFSLTVGPDDRRARLLSDVGQDLFIDLVTGATSPGPGLRLVDGAPARPAVDTAADGRLVGVDLPSRLAVRETAPGSNVLTGTPFTLQGQPELAEPTDFEVGSDGVGYALVQLRDRGRIRQSGLLPLAPASGERAGLLRYFLRRVETIASLGEQPADTRAPSLRIRVPRRVRVGTLLDRRLPLRVTSNEGLQLIVSGRLGRDVIGFGLATRDIPGRVQIGYFGVSGRDRAIVRRAVGRRVRLIITARDWAGNRRVTERFFRLTR